MSLVTGLGLGLLVVVLGAAAITAFALHLRKREHPENHDESRAHHA